MAKRVRVAPAMPEFGPKKLPNFTRPEEPVIKGQTFMKPICPFCLTEKVTVRVTAPKYGVRYYDCSVCVDGNGKPTTFKVQIVRRDSNGKAPQA